MGTEQNDRRYYGITDKGRIEVIHKMSYSDDGNSEVHTYEVRQGPRTIAESSNEDAMVKLACALFEGGEAPIGDPLGKVATPEYLKATRPRVMGGTR